MPFGWWGWWQDPQTASHPNRSISGELWSLFGWWIRVQVKWLISSILSISCHFCLLVASLIFLMYYVAHLLINNQIYIQDVMFPRSLVQLFICYFGTNFPDLKEKNIFRKVGRIPKWISRSILHPWLHVQFWAFPRIEWLWCQCCNFFNSHISWYFVPSSGDYGDAITLETLKDFHRRRVQILADSGADLLAFETVPNKLEAQVSQKIWTFK